MEKVLLTIIVIKLKQTFKLKHKLYQKLCLSISEKDDCQFPNGDHCVKPVNVSGAVLYDFIKEIY